MEEYAEYADGRCIYNGDSNSSFQIKIFLKEEERVLAYVLFVLVYEKIEAIYRFELEKKEDNWFFSWIRIFPPDKDGWKTKETLGKRKDIAQAIFLEKITKNCWEIIWQLSGGESINKKELGSILRKNL